MSNSGTSSVTRYRPAILALTGVATLYAAYFLYDVLQSSPTEGLHRSNAVRRRVRRRPSVTAEALSLAHLGDRQLPNLGNYDLFGTFVPFSTQNIVPESELREIITAGNVDASPQAIETAIADVYDSYLDRMFESLFDARVPAPAALETIRRWIGNRIPDSTAVTRAALRHAQRHIGDDAVTAAHGQDDARSVAPTELSWETDEDAEDDDGQTLQRTLYHIAEDRAKQEGVVHRGITCNGCDEKPIRGIRWHCANCLDFDLCSNCEATNSHHKTHVFYKIRVPAPYLGFPKQEPLYPGKPDMMHPSIDPAFKKRLVNDTTMESEELEALWDQFTCLASTEWTEDKSGVGWALDRRAFNHAFIPRYTSFVAAPNLIYDRIFAYFDTDKNGLIGFEEWIRGLDGMHTTDVEVKARIVFNGYDIDGDGFVSRKDMLRVLRAFYAVEKEATRNYIAELTEELSVRGALDTIRSSQPLGSVFPPDGISSSREPRNRLRDKRPDAENISEPLVSNGTLDKASRIDILSKIDGENELPEHILMDRWSRKHFYVDEEEDLDYEEGPSESESKSTGARDYASRNPEAHEKPEQFPEPDDTSQPTSSSPDRGGYKVPVYEQEIGTEILYQVTQQGFNELLDPLFKEKEDLAMDAFEMRAERRKRASDVDHILDDFKLHEQNLKAVHAMGFFQFAGVVTKLFCAALNGQIDTEHNGSIRDYLQSCDGAFLTPVEARIKLGSMYARLEESVMTDHAVLRVVDGEPTRRALWDVALCRQKLETEIIEAVMACVHDVGWISHPDRIKKSPLDLTMPQFRPNSSADDGSSLPQSSTVTPEKPTFISHATDGRKTLLSKPGGPFFVLPVPQNVSVLIDQDASEENVSSRSNEQTSHEVTPSVGPIPTRAEQAKLVKELRYLEGDSDPNTSRFWSLYITSTDDRDKLGSVSIRVLHNHDASKATSYPDQMAALIRNIRQVAMDPESSLHIMALASFEVIELEIRERNGSGRINFEEFASHMRQGELRFLESWMEWISI